MYSTTICPIHQKPHIITTWVSRAIAILFLYTSVTLSKNITLMNTPVVKTIREEYPTWQSVILDVFLTLCVFGIITLIGFRILQFSKHHHVSQKWIKRLTNVETKILRNFMGFLFFLAHSTLVLSIAMALWSVCSMLITYYNIDLFNVPRFSSQPVVMLMGILSLAIFINSFQWWNRSMAKLFCIRCKL